MADAIFEHPRLAALYDPFDPDRSDLEAYESMVDEFGARSVLDVGCGTGTFACRLAARGIDVVGLDPAVASLQVAQTKPWSSRVRWIQGTARSLPPLTMDLATMTANVAQVFLTDTAWRETLLAVRAALRPGGRVVFETRNPEARAWLRWNRQDTQAQVDTPQWGVVDGWCEVTDVHDSVVSFRWTYAFERDGVVLTSDSTLRFRSREEVTDSLRDAGLVVDEVRDAPDRPGKELVFIAGLPTA